LYEDRGNVPARTAGVFWRTRPADEQILLLSREIDN
jgi:hypothetical protein